MPSKIFISYAHKDEAFKDELVIRLKGLQRNGYLITWHDRKIEPGQLWDAAIKSALDTASIIVFLVSPDFLDSDYIHNVEIKKAFERYHAGQCKIVPIIIRPCHFQDTAIGELQALPKNAKPISTWSDKDEAWYDVLEQLKKTISFRTEKHKTQSASSDKNRSAFFNDNDLEQLEQQGLKTQAVLTQEKLNRIRKTYATETDPSLQFKYEGQMADLEKVLAELKTKIKD